MLKFKFNTNKGFTLIELIVVIAIIGILSAIIIPNFGGFTDMAKNGADKADLRNLNSVTSAYRAEEPQQDPFIDTNNTSDYLMQFLVDQKYLNQKMETRQKDVEFRWDFNLLRWQIASKVSVLNTEQVGFGIPSGHYYDSYITSYSGIDKDIYIPKTIGNITVAGIYQDAFRAKGLTSLAFDPNSSITRIHARAFKDNSLTEVVIPNSVKRLDLAAFYGNSNLTKVTIGDNVYLEQNVFQNNDKFKTLYESLDKTGGTYVYVDGNWVKQ